MKLLKFLSRKHKADQQIIDCLESLLKDAKEGNIHRLVVVGVNENDGVTHKIRHGAIHATMIGALSCVLHELQAKWLE